MQTVYAHPFTLLLSVFVLSPCLFAGPTPDEISGFHQWRVRNGLNVDEVHPIWSLDVPPGDPSSSTVSILFKKDSSVPEGFTPHLFWTDHTVPIRFDPSCRTTPTTTLFSISSTVRKGLGGAAIAEHAEFLPASFDFPFLDGIKTMVRSLAGLPDPPSSLTVFPTGIVSMKRLVEYNGLQAMSFLPLGSTPSHAPTSPVVTIEHIETNSKAFMAEHFQGKVKPIIGANSTIQALSKSGWLLLADASGQQKLINFNMPVLEKTVMPRAGFDSRFDEIKDAPVQIDDPNLFTRRPSDLYDDILPLLPFPQETIRPILDKLGMAQHPRSFLLIP